jgi:hypothetical protein
MHTMEKRVGARKHYIRYSEVGEKQQPQVNTLIRRQHSVIDYRMHQTKTQPDGMRTAIFPNMQGSELEDVALVSN